MEQHIRRLRLNHVENVRDLGGYEADGGMIRWNMLYRAGDLSGADEGDWERLKAAGVRTILDLRSASELRVKPDRPPPGDFLVSPAAPDGGNRSGTSGGFGGAGISEKSAGELCDHGR